MGFKDILGKAVSGIQNMANETAIYLSIAESLSDNEILDCLSLAVSMSVHFSGPDSVNINGSFKTMAEFLSWIRIASKSSTESLMTFYQPICYVTLIMFC